MKTKWFEQGAVFAILYIIYIFLKSQERLAHIDKSDRENHIRMFVPPKIQKENNI